MIVQQIISGLALGCVYGLIALGFVLIFKATEVINFAQGEMMMLGAFVAFTLMTTFRMPFIVAFLVTPVICGAMGILLERTFIRPLVKEPVVSIMMVTIGLSITLRAVAGMIWSYDTLHFPHEFPEKAVHLGGTTVTPFHLWTISYPVEAVHLGGITITPIHLWIISITVALVVVLYLFFKFTTVGISLQASAQNRLASMLMGISVKRVYAMTWALSGVMGAVAGMLIAPISFLNCNMGYLGLKAFPAAVIGGFNSIPGAIVGGLIIGVTETLAGTYLTIGFKDVVAYVVMLAVLMIRPEGIFGTHAQKKV
ncbi:MAG: branched-chain amino acid ABC transporter permease [Proteobacteria bacterium]|nr:branched-chain amino acid ABC transporter permease [Pseudomonadota bacterium]